ncbi:MAG: nuclear transport factor 2 family protein [Arenimonas sp.]
MKKLFAFTFIFILLLSGLQSTQAQVSENTKLFGEIMALDSQLFDEGFNQCKPNIFEHWTDEKLEFFHDKVGVQNRKEFLEAVKRNICSNLNEKPMRTLVAGSTKVYPLENNGVLYGAIQQGEHQFHTKGTDPAVAGYTVAKFTNVWLLRDGKWKLKTALSFDHQQMTGKAASNIPVERAVKQRVKLMELTIASLSWSLYFRDLKN